MAPSKKQSYAWFLFAICPAFLLRNPAPLLRSRSLERIKQSLYSLFVLTRESKQGTDSIDERGGQFFRLTVFYDMTFHRIKKSTVT